ncbi:hypothetical protein SeMB42_g02688 [Synchytrium endobioticum]|nr:hypothetical protein SeMB42_g02688 [Synchytrium endobioticum]
MSLRIATPLLALVLLALSVLANGPGTDGQFFEGICDGGYGSDVYGMIRQCCHGPHLQWLERKDNATDYHCLVSKEITQPFKDCCKGLNDGNHAFGVDIVTMQWVAF